jgi:hypothetical protein
MTMHFSFLVTRNINLIETLNTAESHPTNCINFTNNDCIVKYGEQAFCRDEKCYCDRRLSFIKAGKCGTSDRHERDQLFLVPVPPGPEMQPVRIFDDRYRYRYRSKPVRPNRTSWSTSKDRSEIQTGQDRPVTGTGSISAFYSLPITE